MKRVFQIFLIILSFIFLTACSFFSKEQVPRPDGYKPIPESMSKQYKQEMEQIIEEEIPKSKQYIDDNLKDAEYLKNNMIINGYNDNNYTQLTNIVYECSLAYDMNIFMEMVKITIEKYLGDNYNNYEIFDCGDSYALEVFIYPYIQDNKINTKPIIKLSHYANKQYKIVEKYIKDIENHKNYYKIDTILSNKIKNFDNYNPVPKNLLNIYIKQIPSNLIVNYRLDMNKALNHILHDKITYNHKTLMQMLLDFNKESDKIYLKYTNNPDNYEQNKLFVDQLRQINGTISLYPDAIIEQFQPYIEKYDLRLVPGSENDIFLYKYYIEKYDIKYSNEFKKLLKLKEYVYIKTDIYISEISNEF